MSLAPGARVGSYEITALIGQGGMGEVWRGTDSSLGRQVAIKVLPAALGPDPERIARLEREAKTLASLNHPNIAAIYGFERSNDVRALVMELVDGPTLAERIAQEPLTVEEAIGIAKQIADALEAAHEQGIVHRDLKPANIKVRPDGVVKVLDFGLAKALGPAEAGPHVPSGAGIGFSRPDVTASPTITSPALLTGAGVILGTAAYMAPEQARGRAVDRRADIWAFGCVLYEMLTGKRAFDGEDVSDMLASVMRSEPAWDALPADVPGSVRTFLQGCLRKDVRERVRDIGDMRLALQGAFEAPGVPSASRISRRTLLAGAGAGALLLLLGLGVGSRMASRSTVPSANATVRLTLPLPAGRHLPGFTNTAMRPPFNVFDVSNDGRLIVYAATDGPEDKDNARVLFLRALDQPDARLLAGTEGAWAPVFSRDGSSIAFSVPADQDRQDIRRISIATGAVRTIARLGPEAEYGFSWTDDNTILFGGRGGIYEIGENGGNVTRRVTAANERELLLLPEPLPGGRAVLFNRTDVLGGIPSEWDIVAASLETGESRLVVKGGSNPRYVDSGHLLFMRTGRLMAVRFDPERLEATGEPIVIAEDVMQSERNAAASLNSGAGQFRVSDSGTLVYLPGGIAPNDEFSLAWIDRNGAAETLPLPPAPYRLPRVSPDGTRLAYRVGMPGYGQLWVYDIERRVPMPLDAGTDVSNPVWSPDGTKLLFTAGRAEQLAWIAADGSGKLQPVTDASVAPSSWSATNGVAVQDRSNATNFDIGTLAVAVGAKVKPFVSTPALEAYPVFSPDGQWLAYVSDQTGRDEVYVRPFPQGQPVSRLSVDGGRAPAWAADGREIFFIGSPDSPRGWFMSVGLGAGGRFTAPRMLFERVMTQTNTVRGYDVAPNGRFIGIRNTGSERQPLASLNVVLNWVSELERTSPAR